MDDAVAVREAHVLAEPPHVREREERFFGPESVAFIGATEAAGGVGRTMRPLSFVGHPAIRPPPRGRE